MVATKYTLYKLYHQKVNAKQSFQCLTQEYGRKYGSKKTELLQHSK